MKLRTIMSSIMRWRSGLIGFSLIGGAPHLEVDNTPIVGSRRSAHTSSTLVIQPPPLRVWLSREAGSFLGRTLPFAKHSINVSSGEGFRTPAVSERGAATGRRPEASQERTCGWGARAIGEGLWGFGRCDATAWTSARTI